MHAKEVIRQTYYGPLQCAYDEHGAPSTSAPRKTCSTSSWTMVMPGLVARAQACLTTAKQQVVSGPHYPWPAPRQHSLTLARCILPGIVNRCVHVLAVSAGSHNPEQGVVHAAAGSLQSGGIGRERTRDMERDAERGRERGDLALPLQHETLSDGELESESV
eukprot:2901388-Rhodomonas_salina.3